MPTASSEGLAANLYLLNTWNDSRKFAKGVRSRTDSLGVGAFRVARLSLQDSLTILPTEVFLVFVFNKYEWESIKLRNLYPCDMSTMGTRRDVAEWHDGGCNS